MLSVLHSTAGIYALVSFTLARRTREIGIRIALGAAPRRIITSTFWRAFGQVGAGVLVGGLPSAALLAAGVEGEGGLQSAGAAVASPSARLSSLWRWHRARCRSGARCESSRPRRCAPTPDPRVR